jgi:hypothetical protein
MNVSYLEIYKEITQIAASLIALVGVFVIFRIQMQRERIRDSFYCSSDFDGL